MYASETIPPPEKVRVSMTERLVPSLSLGAASVSGAVGAVFILRLFETLRNAETAGRFSMLSVMVRIELVTGAILVVAILLGVAAIGVSAVRMFAAKKTASPVGIRVLALGILSLVPPSLVFYALWLATDALNNPAGVNLSNIGRAVSLLTYGALISAGVSLLLLLIFAFVPQSSRLGRKYSPAIALVILEIAMVGLAAMFFFEARSIAMNM